MKARKITSILLMAMLGSATVLVGCGNQRDNSSSTEETSTAGENKESNETTESTENKEDLSYVYGTARLAWEQFWSGEEIDYSSDYEFGAINESTDSEGVTDLGGFVVKPLFLKMEVQ